MSVNTLYVWYHNVPMLLERERVGFLCLWFQLTSSLHKKVLVSLHSEVMPHLMEPRLLLDFLVDSYDTGMQCMSVVTVF